MSVTIHELTKTPFVLGWFNRLAPAGTELSRFYRLGPTHGATELSPKRSLVYDLFDNTRTMARGRGPYVGPGRTPNKRMGQGTAHIFRLYEAIDFMHERLYGMRPIGGQVGEIDTQGQSYVSLQQRFMAQRFQNAIEFMCSRMFRGGFGIDIDGDNWNLVELGDGMIDVEFNIPDSHKDQLAVGGTDGATDVIDVSWDDAAAKIIQQLLNLNKASERETGYQQKHIWINSTTYGYLLNNTQLSSVRGTANRIFDRQDGRQIATTNEARSQGYDIIFGAMPQFTFHVYDAVSHVGVNVDSETFSELSMYIPDNMALITPDPEPGGWYGSATCVEPIRETDVSEVMYPTGLHSWAYPTNDPPGFQQRVLYNFVPLLYNPKAFYWAEVIF